MSDGPIEIDGGLDADARKARRRMWHLVATALSLSILALSVYIVARTVATVDWHDLRLAIQSKNFEQFVYAGLAAAGSYLALTGYDALALRQLHLQVPYKTTALASFTSYAISFTLGFPLITGGTVRYWIYSQAGVSPGRVASLTLIAGITFWLGMVLVIGITMAFNPVGIANLNQLNAWINQAIGIGLLTAIGVYLVWVSRSRRRLSISGLRIELPGFLLTIGQLLLGVIDLCFAAATLYVLLPRQSVIPFLEFLAAYVFGCLMGIASNAPGGIGAFEATMLKTLTAPSVESLLASLLLFRVVYYFVPFMLALAMLGAHEALRRWKALREAMDHAAEERDNGV